MNANETVTVLLAELTGDHRTDRIADLISDDYWEHLDSPVGPYDRFVGPSGFDYGTGYAVARTIVDGERVLTHALIKTPGQPDLVGVDLWKLRDGQVTERWSSRVPRVSETASGRSQLDGTAAPDGSSDSRASKRIVSDWTRTVLLGADFSAAPRFISDRSYEQHNPDVADGIDGFAAATAKLRAAGLTFDYQTIDLMIAEDDFVFTRGQGNLGQPVIFNDIWRLDGGKIVEHWDVVSPRAEVAEVARTLHSVGR
jgi:predicted SnoaL-like aldol condensation-catalyzing enzyme